MSVEVRARKIAEEALRALGKNDDLYAHHGGVCAHQSAYDRLAVFFVRFVEEEKKVEDDPGNDRNVW